MNRLEAAFAGACGLGLLYVAWHAVATGRPVQVALGTLLAVLGGVLLQVAWVGMKRRPAEAERQPHQRLRGAASVPRQAATASPSGGYLIPVQVLDDIALQARSAAPLVARPAPVPLPWPRRLRWRAMGAWWAVRHAVCCGRECK